MSSSTHGSLSTQPKLSVGDVVYLVTRRTKSHYVYGLLDDDGVVFYIGRSCDVSARIRAHVYSGVSIVREKLKEMREVRALILAGPMTEAEAAETERKLIDSTPNLINQEHRDLTQPGGADRHPAVKRFAGLP